MKFCAFSSDNLRRTAQKEISLPEVVKTSRLKNHPFFRFYLRVNKLSVAALYEQRLKLFINIRFVEFSFRLYIYIFIAVYLPVKVDLISS